VGRTAGHLDKTVGFFWLMVLVTSHSEAKRVAIRDSPMMAHIFTKEHGPSDVLAVPLAGLGVTSRSTSVQTDQDTPAQLIDIASKDGNFLLNVGPTSEGVAPAPRLPPPTR
jgi:hypothetical protein